VQAECRLISTTFSIYKGKSKGKTEIQPMFTEHFETKSGVNKEKSGQD